VTEWTPVPEPMTWTLVNKDKPGQAIMFKGLAYSTVTIGAPTSEDILKATAVPGARGIDVTLRIIESASRERVPYDVLKAQPHWLNQQISDYMEEFVGAPAPDPLEAWRKARTAARVAEARAEADTEAAAAAALAEAQGVTAPAS